MLFNEKQVAEMLFNAVNVNGCLDDKREEEIARIEKRIKERYNEIFEGSFIEVVSKNNTYRIPFGSTLRDREEFFHSAIEIMSKAKTTGEEISILCLDGEEWLLYDISEEGVFTFINQAMNKTWVGTFGGEILKT